MGICGYLCEMSTDPSIPTDNHIRDLLDAVLPQQIFPMLGQIFAALHERGYLQALRTFDGQL